MAYRVTYLALLLAMVSSTLLVAPAQARGLVKPTVSLRASSTSVVENSTVKLTGRVSGPAVRQYAQLQKRQGSTWLVVAKTRVRASRYYSFATRVTTTSTYRVKVLQTRRTKSAASPLVRVTTLPYVDPDDGTDPDEPDNPTDPEDPDPQDPVLSDYSLDQLRYDLVTQINEYRAVNGVGPINMTVQMNLYAQSWSDEQKRVGGVTQRENWPDSPAGYEVDAEFVTFNGLPADVVEFFAYQDKALLLSDHAYIGIGMALYNEEIGYWTLNLAHDEADVPEVPQWNEQTVRAQILKETNEFRAANGKAPLQLMPQMNSVAQNWSQHMADSNTFQHNPNYSTQIPSGWRGAGENIAAGYDPTSVVTGWINSPGHRANMLGDFTHIGIGYGTNDGSTYKRYYTQVFARY